MTKEVGAVSETVTQDNVSKELQVRMSLAQILEKQRSVAVETVVREQFENDLKGLTDAEQDSKELKSAKRSLLFDRIIETVKLPFPVGPATVDGEPAVKDSLTKSYVKKACDAIYKSIVRQKIAVDKRRPDGRSATEIRPIEVEVSVMPRTHGSGLFTRGQTQIMSLLTLGTAKEGQRIDDLSLERDRRFMHHYNFPPYSVGETGRHGLAEAARHRSRGARTARTRGRSCRRPRTSRTRSASSPRRSSRTARRRWARSAARPSR